MKVVSKTKKSPGKAKQCKKRGKTFVPESFEGETTPFPNPKSMSIELNHFRADLGRFVTLKAAWEEWTPAYARYVWNNLNPANRKLRANSAHKLRRDVEDGKFVPTGETLIFDDKDDLQNGQHRVFAIASGNKSVFLLVVRNAPDSNYSKIDRGITRDSSDVLHGRGVSHSEAVTRLARRIKQWENGGMFNRRGSSIDNDQILPFIAARPKIQVSVDFTIGLFKNKSIGLLTPTILSVIHYLCAGEDQFMGDEFLRLIATNGVGLVQDLDTPSLCEPVNHLIKRLKILHTAKREKQRSVKDAEVVSLALAAWNSFCDNGRSVVKKIQVGNKVINTETKSVTWVQPKLRRPKREAVRSANIMREYAQRMRMASMGLPVDTLIESELPQLQ